MKACFLLSTLLILFAAKGNSATRDTLRIGDTILVQVLLGSWVNADSSRHTIEFKLERKQLKLVSGQHFHYDFFRADSVFVNPLNGVYVKWPPDDCSIRMIDNVQIEITYTPFGGAPARVRYERLFNHDGFSRH